MDFFVSIFEAVLDRHAPKQTRRVQHSLQPNWCYDRIKMAGRKRDFCHERKDTENYKLWRTKTKILMQQSKNHSIQKQ